MNLLFVYGEITNLLHICPMIAENGQLS